MRTAPSLPWNPALTALLARHGTGLAEVQPGDPVGRPVGALCAELMAFQLAGLSSQVRDVTVLLGAHPIRHHRGPLGGKAKPSGFVLEWRDAAPRIERGDQARRLAAIEASQAVIEFLPAGAILSANTAFLTLMGYNLDEIRGRHHNIFVDPIYRDSRDYVAFWDGLRSGRPEVAGIQRMTKAGKAVWIKGFL